MLQRIASLALALLTGCGVPDDEETSPPRPEPDPACDDYPEGAVEPMALDEVIWPYRWPEALHRDGREAALDLGAVPCDTDPDIDWSPFDVLLFVSIPAW